MLGMVVYVNFLLTYCIACLQNTSAIAVLSKEVSLVCPLSHKKVAHPVRLPRCDDIFDRLSVEEKVEGKPFCVIHVRVHY